MNQILQGLRIVEVSAFVAAPLCGMTLAQQGATVIRVDPLEGGLDARRWPVTEQGRSLYWAGLNKGKLSLAVNTRTPEGQELVTALASAPGEDAGILLTNFPAAGWLAYERLRARRADLIMLNITGNPDGSSAVDYTINCSVGFPLVTGPGGGTPVNHVLPAWDLVAGLTAATGILGAERHRRRTGEGQYIKLPLADVAFAMTGNLGYIGEVEINREERRASGNDLYGAYGHAFETGDGRLIYVVGITGKQWQDLVKVTGLAEKLVLIEPMLGVKLEREGDRYRARDAISAVLEPWFRARTLAQLEQAFAGTAVCWGPYQSFKEMVERDPRCSPQNPLFAQVEQPGIGTYRVPRSPLQFSAAPAAAPRRAPLLGEHTDQVLGETLGLTQAQIGALREKKVVGGPIDLADA
jgi:2-methylfumaryl-CoA isomerase